LLEFFLSLPYISATAVAWGGTIGSVTFRIGTTIPSRPVF
jgi:hypothetical protein